MDTLTKETGLIKIGEVTTILSNASDILNKNEELVAKAVNKGQFYLDTIEAESMSDELDADLNNWQVLAKQALAKMNERRSPITQMMTAVAKAFTSLESKIDPAKPDSVYSKIQAKRNEYAAEKERERRKKEAEILRKKNVEDERISLKSEIERQLRLAYQNKLYEYKSYYTNKVNSCDLDGFDAIVKMVKEIKTVYPRDKFMELAVNVVSIYIDSVEKERIILVTKAELFDELSANFRENMEDLQRSLNDILPSKKSELNRIAMADEAEKKRLNDLAEKRRQDEDAELQRQQAEAIKSEESKVELQKQIAVTGNLFDATGQLSEINSGGTRTRSGFKITVKSMAGWGAIFLFWFEKEGQKADPAEAGKKSLDQMKGFCERHAHKTGNASATSKPEIVIHPDVVYEEDFKAIATK